MLDLICSKSVLLIPTQTAATNATASGTMDTRGFKYAEVMVNLSALNATGSVPTVCTISECDTSNGSFATFSGMVSGTDYTLPTSYPTTSATTLTATSPIYARFGIDLRGRKRYLQLEVTPGTTTSYITGIAKLTNAEEMPNSTTDVNAKVWCLA